MEAFEVSGRIALKTPTRQESAGLQWTQTGARHISLSLSGPLGLRQATLQQRDNVITLEQDGETRRFDPAQALQTQSTNWTLPLAELSWWLRGLPAPSQPHERVLEQGRTVRLTQAGWTLQFEEYQLVNGLSLPKRIRFSGTDVDGKILLKDWKLPR